MKLNLNIDIPNLKSKKIIIPILVIIILAITVIGVLAFNTTSEANSKDEGLYSLFESSEACFNIEYRFLNRDSMAIKITGIKEPFINTSLEEEYSKMSFPNLEHLKRDLLTANDSKSRGSDVSIYSYIGDTNLDGLWDLGESIYIINRGLINDMFEETLPKDLSFFGLHSYILKSNKNEIYLEFRFNDYQGEEISKDDSDLEEELTLYHPIIEIDTSLIPNITDRIYGSKNDSDRKDFYIEYVQKENSINMDKLIPLFANAPVEYNVLENKEG